MQVDLNNYHIRHLCPWDIAAFRSHLKRLDFATRQARFGAPVSDQFLDSYADTAHRLGTVVYGAFYQGQIVASAELRLIDFVADAAAEAALTVEPAFQDQGLGTVLMDRLITAAQNRRVGELFMICLRDNDRMRHLAGKFGARLKIEEGEVTGHIDTPYPTPASLLEEGVQAAQGFLTAFWSTSRLASRSF